MSNCGRAVRVDAHLAMDVGQEAQMIEDDLQVGQAMHNQVERPNLDQIAVKPDDQATLRHPLEHWKTRQAVGWRVVGCVKAEEAKTLPASCGKSVFEASDVVGPVVVEDTDSGEPARERGQDFAEIGILLRQRHNDGVVDPGRRHRRQQRFRQSLALGLGHPVEDRPRVIGRCLAKQMQMSVDDLAHASLPSSG